MNADIKAQWTAALRSGEYKQGGGVLARNDKFCCLGVLCDLAAKAGKVKAEPYTSYEDGRVAYGEEENVFGLPAEVASWAGINADDPMVAHKFDGREPTEWNLSQLNDGGHGRESLSFREIADLIDAQL